MKVLVTGANGFLGSWLTRRLCQDGHQVSILVRGSSDLSEIVNLKLEKKFGDITELESLYSACRGQDAVFHLAGVIAYRNSERAQMELVNVRGTRNVITAVKDLQVPKLVYLSSVVAIGASLSDQEVLNENSEYKIGHLNLGYFETKRQAEIAVKQACDKKEIDAVILNPSTIYGGGDAKKSSRSTQVKIAQGKFPFYTSGGVNVVAVEDVVEGILLAWKKGKTGERYILSGDNLKIYDVFKSIAEFAGVKPPSFEAPFPLLKMVGWVGDHLDRFGLHSPISLENAWTSHLYHWFSSEKAQRELGFMPTPSNLAIEKSVKWMKDHGLLSK